MEDTMKRTTITAVLALVALCAATAAFATPRVDHRQAAQRARIRDGVRSGQLTPREAAHLRMGQRHVARVERRLGADGRFTARERMRLERLQDRHGRAIWRLKHNGRMRPCV
jgi:hypothetical protein